MTDLVSKPSSLSTVNADRIIELWNRGDTSGEIADYLGMSRSQVMGVVHRAKKKGLIDRVFVAEPEAPKPVIIIDDKPFKASSPSFNFHKAKKKMVTPPVPVAPVPVVPRRSGAKSIMDVGYGECRFVVAKGMFCAKETGRHPSWCSEHYSVVYVQSERRRDVVKEVLMHRMKFNF